MNVDTIFVLSDPLKVGRLYFILSPFLDEDLKLDRKDLNSLLQRGKEENVKSRIALAKYNKYEQMVLESIRKGKFKDKRIIFVPGVSPDLMNYGRPGRSGVDPFSHLYGLSEDIISVLSQLPPEVGDYCRDRIVFWPVAPLDFPFVVDGKEAKHFLADETSRLSMEFEERGKVGFGSLAKTLGDVNEKLGNYEFKERLFDTKKLKKTIQDNPSMYHSEREKAGFFSRLSRHIQLGRWLMAEKYAKIVSMLGITEISIYAIKSNYSSDIMEKVHKRTGIPVDRVLRCVHRITALRERDPTYLNQLKGRILAWYAADTGKLVRPEVIIRRKEPLIELRFSGCYKYPFFRCEKGGNKCIEIKKPRMCTAEYISQFIPQEKLQLLADDAMKYNYALIPIEADIYLQNVREYEETTGLRRNFRTSTIKERDFRKGRRLCIPKPFNGAVIEDYDLRASEFGIRCMIARIYAKIDKEHFPVELENRFASIGIAMHWIKNQQPPMWNDFLHNHLLKEIGIEPIPRWKYTEKAVIYNYNGIRISGHPDCVTVFCDPERDEKEWDLGIMDIKRGMYSAYERMGYFDQLLIYGMAVKQMLGLNPETIYLTLIKTPFDRRRFTNEEFAVREEAYRLHRYSKTKVNVASETVDKLHEDIVNSHARQQEILNSKKEAYKERNGSFEKGECVKCFDKPLCEIIFKELEGRSSMLDILPKPYPTKKHRSDLFASLNPPMKEIGLDLRLRMADRTRNDFQTKRRQKTQ